MVLTGEGADELLAGYPKYLAEPSVRRYQHVVPAWAHRAFVDPILSRAPGFGDRLRTLSRAMGEHDPWRRGALWFASLSPEEAMRLTGKTTSASGNGNDEGMQAAGVRALQLADQRHWLPDNLLERGDRMMMAGSVEGRMPFMDTELAELAARMPASLMTGHPRGKAVLRRFARTLIDPAIIERRKVGFAVPVGTWMRERRRPLLEDLLRGEGSLVRRRLDNGLIDRLINSHLAGQDRTKALWALMNLELFLREFNLG